MKPGKSFDWKDARDLLTAALDGFAEEFQGCRFVDLHRIDRSALLAMIANDANGRLEVINKATASIVGRPILHQSALDRAKRRRP
jgi:hypothetical protein